jgi:inosine-uridine nucleoside N-ribohydrolase
VRVLESAQNAVSQAAAKIARNAIDHTREQGYLVGPNMHDSLAVASFLDPGVVKWKDYYVDVETTGELTAGETLGYSPTAGDLRRKPEMERQALNMPIRGAAPSLSTTKTSPVLREKWIPNAKVAVDVDSDRFFNLLIGRLSGKTS